MNEHIYNNCIMTEDVIEHNSIAVENGDIVGSVYTQPVIYNGESYRVTGQVNSYEYKQNGEEQTNYVISAVVEDEDGAIVAEVDPFDTNSARSASEDVISLVKEVYSNISEYL